MVTLGPGNRLFEFFSKKLQRPFFDFRLARQRGALGHTAGQLLGKVVPCVRQSDFTNRNNDADFAFLRSQAELGGILIALGSEFLDEVRV